MRTNLIYAFRNIFKSKINSLITVFGLSVAIACCLIIYFYVSQEYSFNKFHENATNIYRINYEARYANATNNDVRVRPEIVEMIKKEVPQVEKCTEFRLSGHLLKFKENFFEPQLGYASEDFFDIFSFELLEKQKDNLFENPYEIVITEDFADRILETNTSYKDLLGQIIELPMAYRDQQFTIVGVLASIPKNSSINFEILLSGKTSSNRSRCNNYFGNTSVFYQIADKAKAADAERNIIKLFNNYYKNQVELMQSRNQMVKTHNALTPFILNLNDIYLSNEVNNCFERTNSRENFVILITIGILILIIACSNYTILSLGQYIKKIGDVGIRKAMGANSSNIFAVFFSEGFLLTLTAFILGAFLSVLFIPVFGRLAQTEIYTELINIPKIVVYGILAFFVIVLFTSVIPVLVFSKVSPHQMASKKVSIGSKSKLSQVFVSIQYSLSIILIIVTIFIIRQANFLQNRSLGLNTEYIIDVRIGQLESEKRITLFNLLKDHTGVVNQTFTARNFMNGSSDDFIEREDGEQVVVFRYKVDENYIPTLGLNLIYGNNFTKSNVNNNDRSAIVNKEFIKRMDIKGNPIGKGFRTSGAYFTIIGVVDDFHYADLRRRIRPLMLFSRTNMGNNYNDILLKVSPEQVASVKKHIEACYEKVAPDLELTYDFWGDRLKQRYQEEERWSKIVGYASGIAIIISSLGLFGLTILLINQRVKEIGVRKVNGAKISEVLFTINKAFIGWLFGSLLIAAPIAYYIVDLWLSEFPYKIEISWWVFIMAGIVAMFVAFFTVSWQSWKAAKRNPVEALRYE